jgi:TonB family protein
MRIEKQEMLERNPTAELANPQRGRANTQPRQLLIALFLLLVALAVVIGKNSDFWFGTDEAVESDATGSESAAKAKPVSVPSKTAQVPVARKATAEKQLTRKASSLPAVTAPSSDNSSSPAPAVAATRTVLPPLEVEVVAGDTHRTVHPGSNVTTVTTSRAGLPANAAERENISATNVPELRQTVDANYPLLGQHARVQGSVVLQAVVGADGAIEDLRVLSGPAILTAAAQQAVRQWRFKPYLQNGQPVETKARITVNFSIKISDNPAQTS